ncbi:MAG: bifunctional demethylmenaquinone methyltransferase/2-methoxy-6-polyprenyl-1,4-benzoquinol methylase UbiE [Proteobacteria bacterium]|nr:bifunctional demethylmenaquinone methyltransferase/2-methoxy-6-polyprenyl-1,4-benzoquinol methylase UbiE [Pseudomonadota bacterium]
MTNQTTTDFGYEQVAPEEKTRRIIDVFTSVASEYDLMNDIMSLGVHRLWKRQAVHLCAIRKNFHVLDLAGGTGDIARLIHKQLGDDGWVTLCDINANMLQQGRDRFVDQGVIKGVGYVQANAEALPFEDNSFDCMTIAFGLRNVTNKDVALRSMYNKLKYGSQLVILEFSKIVIPFLDKLYDQYSFKLIPLFGKAVANDEASYQYLVESIRMHPDQETLSSMMKKAGFEQVQYHNLTGGIVAIHRAYKI